MDSVILKRDELSKKKRELKQKKGIKERLEREQDNYQRSKEKDEIQYRKEEERERKDISRLILRLDLEKDALEENLRGAIRNAKSAKKGGSGDPSWQSHGADERVKDLERYIAEKKQQLSEAKRGSGDLLESEVRYCRTEQGRLLSNVRDWQRKINTKDAEVTKVEDEIRILENEISQLEREIGSQPRSSLSDSASVSSLSFSSEQVDSRSGSWSDRVSRESQSRSRNQDNSCSIA